MRVVSYFAEKVYALQYFVRLLLNIQFPVCGVKSIVFYYFFAAPKYTLVLFFSAVALFLYLSPLLLHKPCLDDREIPDRPKVMAHRGAPQVIYYQIYGF